MTSTRIQLLLFEIDSVLFRIAVRGWPIDREIAVQFLAVQILDFIEHKSRQLPTKFRVDTGGSLRKAGP